MKKYFKHWFRWITAILPRIYIIVRSLQENLFLRIKYILLVGFMSVIISCNHSDNNTYLNDIRDGEVYRIELLKDGRLWMTENLRYESHNSVCYDNNQSNCKIYGRLYNWGEAITACPDGWHLPSDQEWDTMANFYKSKSYKGKSKFSSSFENLIKSGKNDLGIQLGGLKTGDGGFDNKDIDGFYWSSTDTETGSANCYSFFGDLKIINRLSVDKGAYRSCRCIKNISLTESVTRANKQKGETQRNIEEDEEVSFEEFLSEFKKQKEETQRNIEEDEEVSFEEFLSEFNKQKEETQRNIEEDEDVSLDELLNEDKTLEKVLGTMVEPNFYELDSRFKSVFNTENWIGVYDDDPIYTDLEKDTQLIIKKDEIHLYVLETLERGEDLSFRVPSNIHYGYYAISEKGVSFINLNLFACSNLIPLSNETVINRIKKDIVIKKTLSKIAKSYINYHSFEEGLARVKYDNYWGFINENGIEVIECQFDTVSNFANNFAVVQKDGRSFYIDKSGNEPFYLDSYSHVSPFSDRGFALVANSYGSGLIDTNGVEILPTIYQSINVLQTNRMIVQQDGKYSLIDQYNNEITPLGFDHIEYIKEISILIVVRGGKSDYGSLVGYSWIGGDWGIINLQGEVILPIIHDYLEYDAATGILKGGSEDLRFDSLGNCLEGCD